MMKLKRIYEPPDERDGARILVDRLWPRGLSRERAAVDLWLKDAAPSPELRNWFSHDPARWEQFRERYWEELRHKEDQVNILKQKCEAGTVTLLYAAKDEKRNNAAALKLFLEEKK